MHESFSVHSNMDDSSISDAYFMQCALEQAKLCIPTQSAYNVGCIIVQGDVIVSTGYSRELPGNTHAEECALHKIQDDQKINNVILYTTMEPCSRRLSKKESCVIKCIQSAKIKRIVMAIHEPNTFVKDCTGKSLLQNAGIQVHVMSEFAAQALEVNGHLKEN